LDKRVDYTQLVKIYKSPSPEEQRRYAWWEAGGRQILFKVL
jgi:hypothetical protein